MEISKNTVNVGPLRHSEEWLTTFSNGFDALAHACHLDEAARSLLDLIVKRLEFPIRTQLVQRLEVVISGMCFRQTLNYGAELTADTPMDPSLLGLATWDGSPLDVRILVTDLEFARRLGVDDQLLGDRGQLRVTLEKAEPDSADALEHAADPLDALIEAPPAPDSPSSATDEDMTAESTAPAPSDAHEPVAAISSASDVDTGPAESGSFEKGEE